MRGIDNKLAGQVGEHLVCAELGRRGILATPFSGNVPTFDLLAVNELGLALPIQVKASRSDNWPTDARHWMQLAYDAEAGIQRYHGPAPISNPDLIYVCVAIAKVGGRDRFFILMKADIQQACVTGHTAWMTGHNWKRPKAPGSFDCRWRIPGIQPFEDNWDLIARKLDSPGPAPVSTTDVTGHGGALEYP